MSNASRLADHNPNQSTTPSVQLDALATIYRRAVERYEEADAKKEATRPGGPDDAEEPRNDRTDRSNYTGV